MGQSFRQAAVIPYRIDGEHLQIALVTSSSGKRWIVPKGSIDDGERAREAASRETEEEAGLIGELTRRPIGRYSYSKEDGTYDVDVFVMRVTAVLDSWLEAPTRSRRWMPLDEALECLHPDLHGFVHETARLVQPFSSRAARNQGRSRAVTSRSDGRRRAVA